MTLILLGLCDLNFQVRIIQASLALSVLLMAVWSSGDMHSRIWLYAALFWSCHSSSSCVTGVVPIISIPPTTVMFSAEVEGSVSAPVMIAYKPLSLVVVRSSCSKRTSLSLRVLDEWLRICVYHALDVELAWG